MKRTRIFFCAAGLSALLLLCACGAPAASDVLSDASLDASAVSAALPGSKPEADTPPVLTEAQAQEILDTLGFAALHEFSSPDAISLAALFYTNGGTDCTALLSDTEALEQCGAAAQVKRTLAVDTLSSDLLRNTLWFRRHTLESLSTSFSALTGAEPTAAQLAALTQDETLPWYDLGDNVYYAVGQRYDAPAPRLYALAAAPGGYDVRYTLAGAGGRYTTGVAFSSGRLICGGVLHLDAEGTLVSNTPIYDMGAENYLRLQAETAEALDAAQTQGILQELHDSRAEVLLSQPFASPENLNVQSLLQAGFLPVSERAAELQDVLSYPLGGSFDAHTPEEIKAQFLRLTGAEVTQTQLGGITGWKYHAQYDVYCGYLNDFAAPVAEAAAYRRSNGTIVLAYAQAVEAGLTSVSGVCLLKRSQDGWQVQQNVRF